MTTDHFAARLRELRQARGLTQRQLAERAVLSVFTLRDYEQGKSAPTLPVAAALADALGVSLDGLTRPPQVVEGKRLGRPKKNPEKPSD